MDADHANARRDGIARSTGEGRAHASKRPRDSISEHGFKHRGRGGHGERRGAAEQLRVIALSRAEIGRLRDQKLLARATEIRDTSTATKDQIGVAGHGVTPERIAALTTTPDAFAAVMNVPRGQIVSRSTLARELETDIAALVESVRHLDDLVIQFDQTPAGEHLIEAWRRSRIVIDRGGSNGDPAKPSAGTPRVSPAAPATPTTK